MSPGRAKNRPEKSGPSPHRGSSPHSLTPGAEASGHVRAAPSGLRRTTQALKRISLATVNQLCCATEESCGRSTFERSVR